MKEIILLTIILLASYIPGQGQIKNRKEFGNTVSIGFSDIQNTMVQLSPSLSWRINRFIGIGVAPNYMFEKKSNSTLDYTSKYRQHYVGIGAFARVRILRYIALHTRPEVNYRWGTYKQNSTQHHLKGKMICSWIVSAGLYFPTSQGGFSVLAHYDALQSKHSPYGTRLNYSLGYSINF